MDIYIKIQDKSDPRNVGWWKENGKYGEHYISDGEDLIADDPDYGEFIRGTAFTSYVDLKRATKEALGLARWDGAVNPVATYWVMTDDDFFEVKLDAKNKKIVPVKKRK